MTDTPSLQRTDRVMRQIGQLALKTPGVKHTVAVAGQSLLLGANAPNFGAMFVMLDDFHNRTSSDLSGDAIAAELQKTFQKEIKDEQHAKALGDAPRGAAATNPCSYTSARTDRLLRFVARSTRLSGRL